MKTILSAFFSFFILPILYAASINIYNDSPFPLTAKIISADGQNLGTLKIAPQQQQTWHDHSGGTPTWSQTPYTVIFTCPNGKQYGVYRNVQQGATISAQSATGDLFCEPEKKDGQTDQQGKDQGGLRTDPIWGPP
jgi:hypothetical protein